MTRPVYYILVKTHRKRYKKAGVMTLFIQRTDSHSCNPEKPAAYIEASMASDGGRCVREKTASLSMQDVARSSIGHSAPDLPKNIFETLVTTFSACK